ncbi:hypothetical protein Tco_0149239 [Tanacetum coccineum]
MFHVSNLKKCYADEPLAVLLDGLHLDDKLHFVEEPLEIVGREVKRLKRSRIPLVKVRWNSKRGPEFTWEREDQFKKKYPHLFTKTASSSSAASHSKVFSSIESPFTSNNQEKEARVASDDLRDALSAIFGLSELKVIKYNDDQEMADATNTNAEKAEEEKANEEQRRNEQAMDEQANDDQVGALFLLIPILDRFLSLSKVKLPWINPK